MHIAECIGIVGGPDSYCARSNDVWSLGVILTSMISGHNPWRKAVLTDDCFRAYVNNPGFFRDMLPISSSADFILRRIFTNDEHRVSLSKLRRLILDVDTFFMSDEEIGSSSTYVQMAAVSYLCQPQPPSSSSRLSSSRGVDVVVEEVQVAGYSEKAEVWLVKERLEEVELSPVVPHAQRPVNVNPAHGAASHLATVKSDVESLHTMDILVHPVPQPMTSCSTNLQHSDGDSTTPPPSTRSSSRSRRLCGPESPVGLLRRLIDRILI